MFTIAYLCPTLSLSDSFLTSSLQSCGSPSSLGIVGHQSTRLEGAEAESRVQTAVDTTENSPLRDDVGETTQLFPEYREYIGLGTVAVKPPNWH